MEEYVEGPTKHGGWKGIESHRIYTMHVDGMAPDAALKIPLRVQISQSVLNAAQETKMW